MRRINAVSVKVRAPSRGLVTRWPGEIADQLATGVDKFSLPGMASRASTFASNVRYEDGVIKNAPGYVRVAGADNIVAHWPLDEATGTRFDTSANHLDLTEHPTVDQVAGQISFAAHFPGSAEVVFKITDYTPGQLINPFGSTETPEWDGSFAFFDVNNGNYYGSAHGFSVVVSAGIVCSVRLKPVSGGWQMLIGNDIFDSSDMLWSGALSGSGPAGVYTNSGFGANPSDPATFTVSAVAGSPDTTTDSQGCSS